MPDLLRLLQNHGGHPPQFGVVQIALTIRGHGSLTSGVPCDRASLWTELGGRALGKIYVVERRGSGVVCGKGQLNVCAVTGKRPAAARAGLTAKNRGGIEAVP